MPKKGSKDKTKQTKQQEMVKVTTVGQQRAAKAHPAQEEKSPQPESPKPSAYAIGELLQACHDGDMHRLLQMIKGGISPNACDYDSRYGLHLAACEGQVSAVKFLLESGADPNVKDRFGSTPLDDAVHHGHANVAKMLEKAGASRSDEAIKKQKYQLLTAADEGDLEQVKSLLNSGLDINSADYDKRTALHLATAKGDFVMVKYLLQNGADPSFADNTGLTPFEDAKRRKPRVGEDPVYNEFLHSEKVHLEHEEQGKFGWMFLVWELLLLILFATCTKYSALASSENSSVAFSDGDGGDCTGVSPDLVDACLNGLRQEYVDTKYPLFQDVNVMIFVGFGFLMTFLAKHGFSSVGFNFLVAAATIQWYILVGGFFEQAILHPEDPFHKIELSLDSLIFGDFGAGTVLITFGVLLGKVSPSQLLAVSVFEMIFYSINESIGLRMGIADPGGSMVIHMFGAFFGLACSYVFTPRSQIENSLNRSVYHSDMFAMIGTLFLWMFWPTFNGILTDGALFHRIAINTVLSLTGSCLVGFCSSYIFRGENRFDMVDIQNATLAGGVAIGTSAGLLGTEAGPGFSILIGGLGGLISVLGYTKVQPYLENTMGLSDTCGVHNLHGMPSILGALAGVVVSSQAAVNLGTDQQAYLFPCTAGEGCGGTVRNLDDQWKFQLAYMFITLAMSIVGGVITGYFIRDVELLNPWTFKQQFMDSTAWEVPTLETPYYFDERGEIFHDPHALEAGKDHGVEDRLLQLEATLASSSSSVNKSKTTTEKASPEAASGTVSTMFQAVMARLEAMDARMQLSAAKSQ